jgi:hypothetical protein
VAANTSCRVTCTRSVIRSGRGAWRWWTAASGAVAGCAISRSASSGAGPPANGRKARRTWTRCSILLASARESFLLGLFSRNRGHGPAVKRRISLALWQLRRHSRRPVRSGPVGFHEWVPSYRLGLGTHLLRRVDRTRSSWRPAAGRRLPEKRMPCHLAAGLAAATSVGPRSEPHAHTLATARTSPPFLPSCSCVRHTSRRPKANRWPNSNSGETSFHGELELQSSTRKLTRLFSDTPLDQRWISFAKKSGLNVG